MMNNPSTILVGTLTAAVLIFPSSIAIAFADTTSSAPAVTPTSTSDTCINSLALKDDATSTAIDVRTASEKAALAAHKAALTVAMTTTDSAMRRAAIKKAQIDLMMANKDTMKKFQDAEKAALDVVKASCGRSEGMRMMEGKKGRMGDRSEGKDDKKEGGGFLQTMKTFMNIHQYKDSKKAFSSSSSAQ